MVLTEQTYKNLNRIYYVGRQKGYDRSKALHNKLFYLTTDFVYAAFYAKQDGYVETYRLRNGINVFNARSEQDYNKIRKFLLGDVNLNIYTKYLDDLKYKDWTHTLGSFEKRDILVDVLLGLGYDGYFNYEYTEAHKADLKKQNEVVPIFDSEPSIGVINLDKFQKIDQINGLENFLEKEKFQDFKKLEIKDINEKLDYYVGIHNVPRETIKIIILQNRYLSLTNKEISEIVDNYEYKETLFENVYNGCSNTTKDEPPFITWLKRKNIKE